MMQESNHLILERVAPQDKAAFRQMAEAYWQELMPRADVIQDLARRNAYFAHCFTWEGGNRHPFWANVDGRRVGFLSLEGWPEKQLACVEDFYVSPTERRQGVGAAMVRALIAHLDTLGIELIELNVRRDNPNALAFWEAQGFRIALFRLRQYRDPATGTGFIGALSSDFSTDAKDVDGHG